MPKTKKKPNKGGRPRFAQPRAGSLPARVVRSYDTGHRSPSDIRKDLDLTDAEYPRVYKALDRYRPAWRES